MCGIAGMIDLTGRRPAPAGVTARMAAAITHRGPDEDGFFDAPGVGLANRRLSIVGLADGKQPISNEGQTVWTVFNGELFDYPEKRKFLEDKGHTFRTRTDTELIPHLWEEFGEGMFDHLRGQFAIALYDARSRSVVLARDRFGICPLLYTVRKPAVGDGSGTEWLFFASEIKALLASGHVPAEADPHGIGHAFTYFATPGPATCFAGVKQLLPGRILRIQLGETTASGLRPKAYWEMNFPDQGQEADRDADPKKLADRFEEVLLGAVERRLRADVPVVSYLSGGVDSGIVVAMASKALGRAIPTFTVGVDDERYNEENEATQTARHVGTKPIVVKYRHEDVLGQYPALIHAAEAPVVDTSAAALLMLARSVRDHGYKVALTGEGSDEWLAGYPYYKWNRILQTLNAVPGLNVARAFRRTVMGLMGIPKFPVAAVRRAERAAGGPNPWLLPYGLMATSKLRFFSRGMWERVADQHDFEDLEFDAEKLYRWHPLNRGLYVGAKVQLPGLLLSSKGDRVAMNSSVETRYPFLDEAVFDFLAKLHPRWKLNGLTEKYLLRVLAGRWLPKEIAWRPKAMFRAPMDSFHLESAPAFVEQLLSDESLRRAGYFDPAGVKAGRERLKRTPKWSTAYTSLEMGLCAVTATQLWHQTFIDRSLADVPAVRRAA